MIKDKEFYKKISKKGLEKRWKKEHSKVKINKRLTKEKVAINAYICGDGWIKIRRDINNKTHYEIKIAQNDKVIRERIINLFKKEFNITPQTRLKTNYKKINYYVVEIKNKPACINLLSLGKYDGLNWEIPNNLNNSYKKEWIKCFFDCEGYVSHSKPIGMQVKSINHKGLEKIKDLLNSFEINSDVYGPYKQNKKNQNDYSVLWIRNKEDIIKYSKLINFYHPKKKEKLGEIINKINNPKSNSAIKLKTLQS